MPSAPDSDSITDRLDEVEQELVHLLSTRADDLQFFTSRQDQLLHTHFTSLDLALSASLNQLSHIHSLLAPGTRDGVSSPSIRPSQSSPSSQSMATITTIAQEARDKLQERQNLKLLWRYCEEQKCRQRRPSFDETTVMQTPAVGIVSSDINSSDGHLSDLSLG